MLPVLWSGSTLMCPFGSVPTPITVPPTPGVPAMGGVTSAVPAIASTLPYVATFGTCLSPGNPAVQAATAAANAREFIEHLPALV